MLTGVSYLELAKYLKSVSISLKILKTIAMQNQLWLIPFLISQSAIGLFSEAYSGVLLYIINADQTVGREYAPGGASEAFEVKNQILHPFCWSLQM